MEIRNGFREKKNRESAGRSPPSGVAAIGEVPASPAIQSVK